VVSEGKAALTQGGLLALAAYVSHKRVAIAGLGITIGHQVRIAQDQPSSARAAAIRCVERALIVARVVFKSTARDVLVGITAACVSVAVLAGVPMPTGHKRRHFALSHLHYVHSQSTWA
jgi:hypothetical protein